MKLRYFAGLSEQETADTMGQVTATAQVSVFVFRTSQGKSSAAFKDWDANVRERFYRGRCNGIINAPFVHDTLAAAYAETGDFEQALKYQEKALALAPPAWRSEYESRKRLYLDGKPYRDPMLSMPTNTGQ